MVLCAFSISSIGWALFAILGILVGFGALVLVHEFGHFIIAKLVGIKVEAFAFGFGPRLFGRKRGDTEYRFNLIPFGGYVKLAGMEGEEGKKPQEIEGGFYAVKPFRRSLAIAAGAIFNFLFAFLLFTVLWFTGRKVPEAALSTTVGAFEEESQEAKSELKVGDKIISVNNIPVRKWEDIFNLVIFANTDTFNMKIIRDGVEKEVTVKSEEDKEKGAYLLPIAPAVKVVVEAIKEDSAAEKAGLKSGDVIETAAGEQVEYLGQFKKILKTHIDEEIELGIRRNGGTIVLKAQVPEPMEGSEYPILGFATSQSGPLVMAYENPFSSIQKTGSVVYWSIKKLFSIGSKYRVKPKAVSGPIGIMTIIYRSLFLSLSSYIWLIGFLSLNLCIVNLLPIPVLDGGHILFAAIEGVRKKPVSEKVMSVVTNVFVVLIIAFFLYVTFNDFMRIFKRPEENKEQIENKDKIDTKNGKAEEPAGIPETDPAK